jgi:hypothetical protein
MKLIEEAHLVHMSSVPDDGGSSRENRNAHKLQNESKKTHTGATG